MCIIQSPEIQTLFQCKIPIGVDNFITYGGSLWFKLEIFFEFKMKISNWKLPNFGLRRRDFRCSPIRASFWCICPPERYKVWPLGPLTICFLSSNTNHQHVNIHDHIRKKGVVFAQFTHSRVHISVVYCAFFLFFLSVFFIHLPRGRFSLRVHSAHYVKRCSFPGFLRELVLPFMAHIDCRISILNQTGR